MRAFTVLAVVLSLAANAAADRALIITPYRPDRPGRVVVVETSIEILDNIEFVPATARLVRSADRTLDAVASTLTNNPSITKVAVQAYGYDLNAKHVAQVALGELRARVVVTALVKRGVSPLRLRAQGFAAPANHKDPKVSFLLVTRAS